MTECATLQNKISKKALLLIEPRQSNQRIIMQQGLFIFPYTLEYTTHQEIITRNTKVIKFHKKLRPELLQYLDTMGFNAFRLMPDLASICEAVKRKVVNDQREKKPLSKRERNLSNQ